MKRITGSLRTRMIAVQLLVIALGAVTLVVLVELLAPSFFSSDLQRMNDMMTDSNMMGDMMARPSASEFLTPSVEADLRDSFDSSFRKALAISLLVAGLGSIAVSRFTTRRILAPLESVRLTTRNLASGAYDQRIDLPSETELAALAEDVNELAEALETTEQRRIQLISEIAHELRTPLTTIEGYLEGMLDRVFEPNDEVLAASSREVRRLKRLADDLSAVSKAEEGSQPLALERLDLAELLAAVISQLRFQFEAKGVEVSVVAVSSVDVRGDRDRLIQVLTNVIGNAVAYTDSGGHITVSMTGDDTDAVVEVTDTGRGLTGEEHTAVFERFYRADNSGPGGSGIGLTIARAIARRHGGDIIATSPGPGEGSTFSLRLPRT